MDELFGDFSRLLRRASDPDLSGTENRSGEGEQDPYGQQWVV